MRAWHFSAVVLLSLAAVSSASAQTSLVEVVKPGDCFRYSIDTKLQGEMSFHKDSGTAMVMLAATASHVFAADGAHVATFAQEALLRDPLDRG